MRILFCLISLTFYHIALADENDVSESLTPVIEPVSNDITTRLEKIENQLNNNALLEMLDSVESLKKEINSLRGEIEIQGHTLNKLKEKQRDLYTDIDRRLEPIENNGVSGNVSVEIDNDAAIDDLQVLNAPSNDTELSDLLFASKICKHTKSNTIVLSKNLQLLASGTGQTSRVDALNQAIEKAKKFNFNLDGAVMASDAFFPFPDCVEIANESGIRSVIQPGGSIKDNLSIEFCNNNNLSMVMTGIRHFKH